MSSGNAQRPPRQKGVAGYLSALILMLVVGFVALGVWTYYRWMVREPTITPEQAEIKALQQLVTQKPKDASYVVALGFAYQEEGKIAQAREQYLKALKLEPKDMASLYNLGILAQSEKKLGEAENYFKKVLNINNKHYLANLGLAEVYLTGGKYDLAVTKAQSLIKTKKEVVNPHLILAQALEKKGKSTEASAEYKTVLQFVPDQQEALKGLERLK